MPFEIESVRFLQTFCVFVNLQFNFIVVSNFTSRSEVDFNADNQTLTLSQHTFFIPLEVALFCLVG